MFYFFFDQDGVVWHYDSYKNVTTCPLGHDFTFEDGRIVFLDEESEVIDEFILYDYKLFDKII